MMTFELSDLSAALPCALVVSIGMAWALFSGIVLLSLSKAALGFVSIAAGLVVVGPPTSGDTGLILTLVLVPVMFLALVGAKSAWNAFERSVATARCVLVGGGADRYVYTTSWQPCIPLLPVATDSGTAWMRPVERKQDGHGSSLENAESWWVYQEIRAN